MKLARSATILLLCLGTNCAAADSDGLHIALTNDDGWQAEGIQALYRSLTEAGNVVRMAAPADQQSGSSAAINGRGLRVVREADAQYSVHACADELCEAMTGAKPASSALIAIDLVRRIHGVDNPDLLVSGINSGANLGSATQLSGTVGATVAAASRTMSGYVPAIAVSTNVPTGCGPDPECARQHYLRVGRFVSRLIAHLAEQAGGGAILPDGLVLNVNYPPVPAKGVRIVAQDPAMSRNGAPVRFDFGCEACIDLDVGESAPATVFNVRPDETPLAPDGELASFEAGYVTIVPMRIDYTADNYLQYKKLLSGFEFGD